MEDGVEAANGHGGLQAAGLVVPGPSMMITVDDAVEMQRLAAACSGLQWACSGLYSARLLPGLMSNAVALMAGINVRHAVSNAGINSRRDKYE